MIWGQWQFRQVQKCRAVTSMNIKKVAAISFQITVSMLVCNSINYWSFEFQRMTSVCDSFANPPCFNLRKYLDKYSTQHHGNEEAHACSEGQCKGDTGVMFICNFNIKNIYLTPPGIIFNVIPKLIHRILLLKTEQNIYWQNKLLHNL